MQKSSGGTKQISASPPGTNDQSPHDPAITGPLQKRSRLNEESKKKTKKQPRKQQEHDGGGVQSQSANDAPAQPGYSLRWNLPISAQDVQRSRQILEVAGLHTQVVEHSALTLCPAECWSLLCYARGASLGPAWIASQVYDWNRRQPQPSQLNRRYDELGRLLAALSVEESLRLIDITDSYCPRDREQWEMNVSTIQADLSPDHAAAFEQARDAVWAIMSEQRYTPLAPVAKIPKRPVESSTCAYAEEWSAVLKALQQDLSHANWRSWIAPLQLLEVDSDTAIIGAPNIFVCDEVRTTYAPSIEKALRDAFGRALNIEVAIGTTVLK